MVIHHIKGKNNITADWLSRLHSISLENSTGIPTDSNADLKLWTILILQHVLLKSALTKYMEVGWGIQVQCVPSSYYSSTFQRMV